MKRITSIILALVLCFSMSINAFASETSSKQEPVSVLTVADENGKDVQYKLYDNHTINIPLYAAKEGETTKTLTEVATLTIRPCFKNCRVLHHFNKMAIAPM